MGNIVSLIRGTVSGFMADNALTRGAAIACYTIFAIAPLLLIVHRDRRFDLRPGCGAAGDSRTAQRTDGTAERGNAANHDPERKGREIGNHRNHHRLRCAGPYRERRLRRNPGGAECHLESRAQSRPFSAGSCAHRRPWPGLDIRVLDDRVTGRQRRPVGSRHVP